MLVSQSPSISPPPFKARRSKAAETWTNGIKDIVIEGGHCYQIPAPHGGVAAEIQVKQRWGGMLAPAVSGMDAQGNALKGDSTMEGFHRVFFVIDPSTGTSTTLDPDKQTLEAHTPQVEEVSETPGSPKKIHVSWTQQARETMDAQGNLTFQGNLHGKKELVKPDIVGPHPSVPKLVSEETHFTEVKLSAAGLLEARQVAQDLPGAGESSQPLSASVDEKGEISVTGLNSLGQPLELLFGHR